MSALRTMPTRETVLAHGFPEGFIELQRHQAHVARAQALGAFLAALWRSLYDVVRRQASERRRMAA